MKGMIWAALLLALIVLPGVSAHCDTLDGPVVAAARVSLESGDPAPVLVWVQKDDEQEIVEALEHAREVRKLGPDAQALADQYFFETLVRIHRAGEDAPYTGLKEHADPAEAELIAAGDDAIASGSDAELKALVLGEVEHGIDARFAEVAERKDYRNVEQGREYVAAYVQFLHYAEGVMKAAEGSAHGEHGADAHAQHDIEVHAEQSVAEHVTHDKHGHDWWPW